ncbi:hypothetical protein CLMAG_51330 [Clostridium magnum DSM 2767]|uniref:Uncharacterized protein n=2 Tax=Clostridium magnum TaxID=33954 RepID=A0A162RAK2_9CLOT|nr:hypothetical protein CLMAG_51330 [Clostridium magnum DSM 2767]
MDKNNSWKQKSAALTLAVSMIMVNPIALSGCNSSNNTQVKTLQVKIRMLLMMRMKKKRNKEVVIAAAVIVHLPLFLTLPVQAAVGALLFLTNLLAVGMHGQNPLLQEDIQEYMPLVQQANYKGEN